MHFSLIVLSRLDTENCFWSRNSSLITSKGSATKCDLPKMQSLQKKPEVLDDLPRNLGTLREGFETFRVLKYASSQNGSSNSQPDHRTSA
jgi:hypothetical protein